MSLQQEEHGPMLKPSSAKVTDRSKEVSVPDEVKASPNQLNVSVVEEDRRELPADNNSASPIVVKELRNRNIVINQRFRKRKNTKGKQEAKKVRNVTEKPVEGSELDTNWSNEYCHQEYIEFLLHMESSLVHNDQMLSKHPDIDEEKRMKVIVWIKAIIQRFRHSDEIYHLTISIFNRYLGNSKDCKLDNIQGYCFSAFKIAVHHVNTFNESYTSSHIYAHDVKPWEYPYLLKIQKATEGASSKECGVKFERQILGAIQWRIDVPNELTFFTEILNLLTVQHELRWELETRIRNTLKSEKIHSIRIAKFKPSVKVMAILNTVIDQMIDEGNDDPELLNLQKRLNQMIEDFDILNTFHFLCQHFKNIFTN